jgi:hypothetical protein
MADDPFRSPKQRLARAKEKIAELKAAIEAFVKREPYTRVVDIEQGSGAELHKIKMTEALPDLLTNLAMEIIEGLRSALDQAGFARAVLDGKAPAKIKSAYFPVADSGAELANVIKGRCKDLPDDIVTLFRSFMPYKGGNDPLWAMNKIRQRTHTALVPVGVASGGFNMRAGRLRGGAIMVPRWDSANNEMIFGRVEPGGEFHYDIEFTLYVAFGDASTLAGQQVVAALDNLAGICNGMLAATEAECRRIGLLKS